MGVLFETQRKQKRKCKRKNRKVLLFLNHKVLLLFSNSNLAHEATTSGPSGPNRASTHVEKKGDSRNELFSGREHGDLRE